VNLTGLLALAEQLPLTPMAVLIVVLAFAVAILRALPPVLHELPAIIRARRTADDEPDKGLAAPPRQPRPPHPH
jgi:hypothetical protein